MFELSPIFSFLAVVAGWVWFRRRTRHRLHGLRLVLVVVLAFVVIGSNIIPWWAWWVGIAAGVYFYRHSKGRNRPAKSPAAPQIMGGTLYQLSPSEFEQAVVVILQAMGYNQVERVGGSGDLSVDVTYYDAAGNKCIAQCKRYAPSNKVGTPDLQQFIGMAYAHHGINAGYAAYFTTSGYTAPAIELANMHGIHLVDGAQMQQTWDALNQHYTPASAPGHSGASLMGRLRAFKEAARQTAA